MIMKYETRSIDLIDHLFKEISTLLPLSPEASRALAKKMRLEFNYNSNHLEGNTLTFGQTELLLFADKIVGNAKASDVEEMKGHDLALKAVEQLAIEPERPLTEAFIKELNQLVLVRPFWKEAITQDGISTQKKIEVGAYKSMPNHVRLRNGEIHYYASPEETPAKMHDLMEWYRKQEGVMHPVQLAIEFHYRFVCIHPFDDGNGRVSRLLMNYILIKNDYPPIIVKSVDKDNYLTALQQADAGDVLAMIEYHEQQLLWSLDLKLKAAKGKSIEEDDDLDKEIELLKREKLAETKIRKTPKSLLELITHINEDVWTDVSSCLNRFADFFVGIKYKIFINDKEVKINEAIINNYPKLENKTYSIFDHYIKDNDVSSFLWKGTMLSLVTTKLKVDYLIELRIRLNDASYYLEAKIETKRQNQYEKQKVIFDEWRDYNHYISKVETKELVTQISNYLIDSIKAEN